MSLLDRLLRRPELPEGLAALFAPGEYALASAVAGDGPVVATSHGLWLPERRRVGWHLVSKASWSGGVLAVVEASEEPLEGAVLLGELPVRRLRFADPGRLPQVVQQRVDGSIRSRHHRELPGGGAWFVQRRIVGREGVRLQVRPDPGTDARIVRRVAAEVAAALPPTSRP